MNADPGGAPERGEAAEHLQRAEQQIKTKVDEKLRQVDEAIHEAERKSKTVLPDVTPPVEDS
jgi:hypothetical protein